MFYKRVQQLSNVLLYLQQQLKAPLSTLSVFRKKVKQSEIIVELTSCVKAAN